jgi:hypothetical protein
MSDATLTGGRVNYYLVRVDNPQRKEQAPYQAECEDIIHALGMTFDEGCEFKALWRTAAARQGNGKPGRKQLDQAIYDAEKRIHYGERSLRHLVFQRMCEESGEKLKSTEALAGYEPKDIGQAVDGRPLWIVWNGGLCPVASGLIVEVKLRNDQTVSGVPARAYRWDHRNVSDDIMAYRHG